MVTVLLLFPQPSFSWGFFAHQRINRMAVFALPPEMMRLFKPNIEYLSTHAVDPDKLRYIVAEEGANHYIDLDRYANPPYAGLPRRWEDAVEKYGADSLLKAGVAPWHAEKVLYQLTAAFKEGDLGKILKLCARLGHYIADLHVPLHAHSNYNGQLTGQEGIHAFWESRIPELFADSHYDFFIGKAAYIKHPREFIWTIALESAFAADSVLRLEKSLSDIFPPDRKYVFEERNRLLVRAYSPDYAKAYTETLQNMVERRMRASIHAVASCWFTAWVNAGQPALHSQGVADLPEEVEMMNRLNEQWLHNRSAGREHE